MLIGLVLASISPSYASTLCESQIKQTLMNIDARVKSGAKNCRVENIVLEQGHTLAQVGTADVTCRIRTSEGFNLDSPEAYIISVSPNCEVAVTPGE
jgi:hypothetical protein